MLEKRISSALASAHQAFLKQPLPVLLMLLAWAAVIAACAQPANRGTLPEARSLVQAVGQGQSQLATIAFDRYAKPTRELPIGVFDSGIGGLTVLEAILKVDAYNNETHQPGPDGRPDFEGERFIYLGDQANMPYGDYPAARKTDFLRELILGNVVFLLGDRYWPSATASAPRHDKPPVKAIVIACNTATAYGLDRINAAVKEWRVPVPVIGIVVAGADGAVRAIAGRNGKGAVAVLATVGTCQSEGYVHAIEQKAGEARIRTPQVIQQGCLGLASAIEGDPSYIRSAAATQSVDYHGPAVGNPAGPIDPGLLKQYDFKPQGLLGDLDQPATWKLNSVDNYIRYHTASLLEAYRRSGNGEPIGAVILGCTHFPYYKDEIAKSLERLRLFHAADGKEPYRKLILEKPEFIDPSDLTARRLYETLAGSGLLLQPHQQGALVADEFFISVPNTRLPGVQLDQTGGFTYDYKYGREAGHFEREYVRRVPMSRENLSREVCETIRTKMPAVWGRLVSFSMSAQ